jgi:hypothetical protein
MKKCPVCKSCLKQVMIESTGLLYWYCTLEKQTYKYNLEIEEDKLVISTIKSMFGERVE